MEIRQAQAADLALVEALVSGAGLPIEGLCDQFPRSYWVAVQGERIVGCVGLERHGACGLLRSLAVDEGARGAEVGTALLAYALTEARGASLAAVYLLTTTAAAFFSRHGFTDANRASAPFPIRQSAEFASICPASATCLVWVASQTDSD
jgi:amino-acid N-acetyltransferase